MTDTDAFIECVQGIKLPPSSFWRLTFQPPGKIVVEDGGLRGVPWGRISDKDD